MTFDKLTAREQRLLQVLGLVLGVGVLFGIPAAIASGIWSAREHNEDVRRQLARIETASQLLSDRRAAREARDALFGKPPVALASFIENAAKGNEIDVPESTDLPDSTTKGYVEHATSAKFRKVGLKALVNTLEEMKKSDNPIAVTGLHISSRSNPDEYDVTLTVSQYEKKAADSKGDGKKPPTSDSKPKGTNP